MSIRRAGSYSVSNLSGIVTQCGLMYWLDGFTQLTAAAANVSCPSIPLVN